MICPEGLAASITATAAAIANGREADELGLISSVFMQLGDTLATISAARLLRDDMVNQLKNGPSISSGGQSARLTVQSEQKPL